MGQNRSELGMIGQNYSSPKRSQNGPKMVLKWYQNSPKMVPKWFKNGSQNGPKMILK